MIHTYMAFTALLVSLTLASVFWLTDIRIRVLTVSYLALAVLTVLGVIISTVIPAVAYIFAHYSVMLLAK